MANPAKRSRKKPASANSPELVRAASEGKDREVERLLKEGASPDSSRQGYTALMAASSGWQPMTVGLLLKAGAHVNKASKVLGTPLLCAFSGQAGRDISRLHDTIQLLCAAGADVAAVDGDGSTALHKACLYGNAEVVEQLLAAGASPVVKNRENSLPIESAVWKGHVEVVLKLIDLPGAMGSKDQYLVNAASQGKLDLVKLLLERGANPNFRSTNMLRATPLGAAAYSGFTDVVRALLAAGADSRAPSGRSDETPHAVALSKNQGAVATLLSD